VVVSTCNECNCTSIHKHAIYKTPLFYKFRKHVKNYTGHCFKAYFLRILNQQNVVIDGLVVIVLVTGPEVCGFKPGRRRWILRAIKIRRTTSGRKKSRRPHFVKFYGMLNIPEEYDRDTASAKFKDISLQRPASLLGV
jgi:hypothetical protein